MLCPGTESLNSRNITARNDRAQPNCHMELDTALKTETTAAIGHFPETIYTSTKQYCAYSFGAFGSVLSAMRSVVLDQPFPASEPPATEENQAFEC